MDGSTLEHSDSDSGESWTLLDPSPAYADDAPELAENTTPLDRQLNEANVEKDEDTDGISVISDSEPESSTPCNISYDNCFLEENRSVEQVNAQYISSNPLSPDTNDHHGSVRSEDDFLRDNTGKHKTYVHRRNKRLSTVLNIIMLGSVITAAGVAIGHMWGARNDCSINTTPSVNKILSNLYKLQEENAYLRSKLKELSLASSIKLQQRKMTPDKSLFKQQRCKKIYEEPLSNKNVDKATKCIDNDKFLGTHVAQPEFEKEFLNDVEKLKNIYQQNKSWLDEEITRRMKNEGHAIKKVTSNMKSLLTSIMEEQKGLQDESMELHSVEPINQEIIENDVEQHALPQEKKITYADSLKSDQKTHRILKREANIVMDNKDNLGKKKIKKESEVVHDILSDEEIKKDDRYKLQKPKLDKKKRDRQKLHKKQKRKNKYEQWEMKGGCMKDYDELSVTSQENDSMWKKPDKNHLSRDYEKINYMNPFSDTDDTHTNKPKNDNEKGDKGSVKNKNEALNWFDKRAVFRTEARKRLERELFGETSPNNAGWYFRRMQRREQCRTKVDNSTRKKLLQRNMNFKTKH